MNKQQIINDIEKHLAKSPKLYYKDFYIGITNDVSSRLFEDHNVKKNEDWWIFRQADNENICRDVEKYYLNLGMDGGSGGGNPNEPPTFIYCYEKNSHTKP